MQTVHFQATRPTLQRPASPVRLGNSHALQPELATPESDSQTSKPGLSRLFSAIFNGFFMLLGMLLSPFIFLFSYLLRGFAADNTQTQPAATQISPKNNSPFTSPAQPTKIIEKNHSKKWSKTPSLN